MTAKLEKIIPCTDLRETKLLAPDGCELFFGCGGRLGIPGPGQGSRASCRMAFAPLYALMRSGVGLAGKRRDSCRGRSDRGMQNREIAIAEPLHR